jgi:hypothetical protein
VSQPTHLLGKINIFQATQILKMLHSDGVEVYIKSIDRNKALMEYIKPNYNEALENKDIERFIEVTSGERFSIVLIFNEKLFRPPHGDDFPGGVSIFRRIDDDVVGETNFWKRSSVAVHPTREFKHGNHVTREAQTVGGYFFGDLNQGMFLLGLKLIHY